MVMFVLGLELVGKDLAVVADHAARDRAVVVLVVDDAAAAGVEPLVADQAVVVLVLVVFSVHDAAARGPFTLKCGGGGTHRMPSVNRSAGRQSGRPERGCSDSVGRVRGARREPRHATGAAAPRRRGTVRQGHSHTTRVSSPT